MRFIVTRTDKDIRCTYPDVIDYTSEAGDLLTTLLEDVVKATGITYTEIFGTTRRRRTTTARHLFCFIARKHLGMFSLQEIGDVFNIKHCSVVHACHNIEALLQMRDSLSRKLQDEYLEILGMRNEDVRL